MIAHVKGELAAVGADAVVIDINGVGYKAFVPVLTRDRLPELGEKVHLYTTTYVREDALALYGFMEEDQRNLFELLLSVSGVGPRMALALLSVLSTPDILNAIADEDARQLQRAPGVGLKLAQRIVLDLKDRVAAMPRPVGAPAPAANAASDAVEALLSLGYNRSHALQAVEQVAKEAEDRNDTGKLVRAALRLLTQKK